MSSNCRGDNDQRCGDGSGKMTSSKEECTSCEQNNNVDNITEGINSVFKLDGATACASCGKEGNGDDMNTCNKCKEVKYCNAACKKKHRSKHKKKCERRVAELHDEQLFKEVEPEECPICFLPMPIDNNTSQFQTCCGKRICNGCKLAMKMRKGKKLCPFCRMPPKSGAEAITRMKKLVDKGDANALSNLGLIYFRGNHGLPRDYQKAHELWNEAGDLGCAEAYYNLGIVYRRGDGLEVDMKKAKHYYELAAMKGHIKARHNLGVLEGDLVNDQRAFKHLIIAAKAGTKESLKLVKLGFIDGQVTKDEYEKTLRAYHERQKEMKSDARDKAAQIRAARAT